MKRDDEKLRELLFKVEAESDFLIIIPETLGMVEEDRIELYHAKLCCDAGLLLEVNNSVYRLTSQGHDYLDAIRSDTVWDKTKAGAAKVGGMTLGMMKDLAVVYVKQEVAEKLGVKFD
ncbi:DUF2513 domain-containing protein [Celeribacter marinus]|uniref:DUF2513 domain-containing protein n=1 Tax=Celeribacter marinus TaxID=1397108 RepID=UPI0031740736